MYYNNNFGGMHHGKQAVEFGCEFRQFFRSFQVITENMFLNWYMVTDFDLHEMIALVIKTFSSDFGSASITSGMIRSISTLSLLENCTLANTIISKEVTSLYPTYNSTSAFSAESYTAVWRAFSYWTIYYPSLYDIHRRK